jgi:hypothetical protein
MCSAIIQFIYSSLLLAQQPGPDPYSSLQLNHFNASSGALSLIWPSWFFVLNSLSRPALP